MSNYLVGIGCEVGVAELKDLDDHHHSNDVPDGTHYECIIVYYLIFDNHSKSHIVAVNLYT